MNPGRNNLLIILTLLLGTANSSFAGLINGVIASTEEQMSILKTQEEVEKLMPPQMSHYIQANQDKLSDENKYKIELTDADKHFAGSSTKKRIVINRHILSNPLLLRKTLIHEWAHVYDHLNLHTNDAVNNIKKCAELAASNSNGTAPRFCGIYKNIKTTVSTTPRFLDLAGFFRNPNGVGRIENTAFTLRSPDIYEIRNSHEAFAVNMEYFTLDPEYKCRRPSLYNFLKEHFRYEPFPTHVCNSPLRILTPSFRDARKALPVIDPARIYQIHYLLADRGSGLSATFGHSMFRLIVCSPQRKYVGPDCLKDLQSHIVLSFRAFVDTPDISSLAGLSGDYPSRLFFIPFLQVVSEYNKSELRDLMSYPLRLSDAEKKAFIERSIEIHWTYNGQYRFISNNCAVESMNLIRSVIKNDNFLIETAETPFGLRDILNNYKLIDDNNLLNKKMTAHRDWATKNGYLLLSYEDYYIKALETISTISKGFVEYDLASWMRLSPQERLILFNRWVPISNKAERIRFAAAFLMLEHQAERLFNESLQNFLLQEGSDTSSRHQDVLKLVMEALELNSSYMKIKETLVTPAQILKTGYGIPSDQDLSSMKEYLEKIAQQKNQNSEKIDKLYAQIFTPERFKISSEISKNIEIFSKALTAR